MAGIVDYRSVYYPAGYSYYIDHNTNGGSSVSQTSGYISSSASSQTVNANISTTVPTKSGYTFAGWNSKSDGTGTNYASGETLSHTFTRTATYDHTETSADGTVVTTYYSCQDKSASTTVYAKWTVATYTVSYNANGGTGAPSSQTKTHGVALTLRSTIPTRTNYDFVGWATSSTGTATYCTGSDHSQNTSYTANASVTLYAIWTPSKAVLTSITSEVTIGATDGGTAEWSNVSGSYHYWLRIDYDGHVKWYEADNSDSRNPPTSLSFTVPSSWLSYLPNQTSATANARIYTYMPDNSTLIGYSPATQFTIKVASNVKPTISSFTATAGSTNQAASEWNVGVQGYSYVTLNATATAGTGASILSYAFTGAGIDQSGDSDEAQTEVIDTTGTKTFRVTVTDTRGRTATTTASVFFYAYSSPTVVSLESYRSLEDGTQDDVAGTWIHSTPVFTHSSIGNRNSLTVKKIEYKKHSVSTWSTGVSPVSTGTGYTFGGSNHVGSIDITKSYDVRCTLTDEIGNTAVLTILVPPVVGFAVGLNNDRARFGGPVEREGLQVDWRIYEPAGAWVHESHAGSGSSGYINLATIVIGSSTIGWPIKLDLSQKGVAGISSLVICFANESNTDPALSVFTKVGNVSAFLYKRAASTWDLYVEKTLTGDFICVTGFQFPHALDGYVEWTWGDTFTSSLPSGTVEATKSVQELKYYDDPSASNYTIGNGNYVSVSYPSGLNGNKVVSISLLVWSSNSGPFTIMPYGTTGASWYIIGAAGTTINGARFRYWYLD